MTPTEIALSAYVVNFGEIDRESTIQEIEREVGSHKAAIELFITCESAVSILKNDLLLVQYNKKDKPEALINFKKRFAEQIGDQTLNQAVQLADWLVAKG